MVSVCSGPPSPGPAGARAAGRGDVVWLRAGRPLSPLGRRRGQAGSCWPVAGQEPAVVFLPSRAGPW